jgi:hypothetical protein
MYLSEVHYLVNHEQHQDRLRALEGYQLRQIAGGQGFSSKVYREIVGWLGTQLISWGTRLQGSQNPDTRCQEASLKISMTAH